MADETRFQTEALIWLDSVHRAAVALCGDDSVADDLVQTTYLKAWQRFDGFESGTNCRAWLLRILRNAWVDQVRKKRPVQAEPESLDRLAARSQAPTPTGPEEIQQHLDQFADEQVVAALLALPEEFRMALFLVDVEGYSHEETAEIMEVPVGTIKSRTSRGRHLLRQRLEAGRYRPDMLRADTK